MLSDGPIAAALAALRARLEACFGPRLLRMTLFGSHARGEATPDSDVDVLVVVEGLCGKERRLVYEEGAEVWMATGVHLAPLAMSSDELAEHERLERLLVEDIRRDGIAV